MRSSTEERAKVGGNGMRNKAEDFRPWRWQRGANKETMQGHKIWAGNKGDKEYDDKDKKEEDEEMHQGHGGEEARRMFCVRIKNWCEKRGEIWKGKIKKRTKWETVAGSDDGEGEVPSPAPSGVIGSWTANLSQLNQQQQRWLQHHRGLLGKKEEEERWTRGESEIELNGKVWRECGPGRWGKDWKRGKTGDEGVGRKIGGRKGKIEDYGMGEGEQRRHKIWGDRWRKEVESKWIGEKGKKMRKEWEDIKRKVRKKENRQKCCVTSQFSCYRYYDLVKSEVTKDTQPEKW